MTASTLSRLPLAAGSAVAASLGRAGLWAWSHYMRAPLASTALLGLVGLTALASSNALYGQTARHPSPFFQPGAGVALTPDVAPVPMAAPERAVASLEPALPAAVPPVEAAPQTTGSVPAPVTPAIPDQPVGNADAFAVQKKLAELGLFEGTVDGFYGPMTARAIRAFEERNGLEPTGALTPDIIDAVKRADSAGRVPTAQPQPQPQPQAQVAQPTPAPVVQAPPPVQQAAIAPQPQQDRVVQRLPALSPVDAAVDTVGSAAAQTIDSIVAAVGGAPTPAAAVTPVPAVPVGNVAAAQPAQQPPQQVALAATAAPAAAPKPPAAVAPANDTLLVTQIQRGLASLGFYRGSIDGHPGDATARAIREFENFHRYRVTGEIKPDLIDLLRQAGAPI